MTANRHTPNGRTNHNRRGERALWPDTPLADAYLVALSQGGRSQTTRMPTPRSRFLSA